MGKLGHTPFFQTLTCMARQCTDAILSFSNEITLVGSVAAPLLDFASLWVQSNSDYNRTMRPADLVHRTILWSLGQLQTFLYQWAQPSRRQVGWCHWPTIWWFSWQPLVCLEDKHIEILPLECRDTCLAPTIQLQVHECTAVRGRNRSTPLGSTVTVLETMLPSVCGSHILYTVLFRYSSSSPSEPQLRLKSQLQWMRGKSIST